MSSAGIWVNAIAAIFWIASAISWWRGSSIFQDNIDTAGAQLTRASRRNREAAIAAFVAALFQALSVIGPAAGWWHQ